jgi:hypothetical protein
MFWQEMSVGYAIRTSVYFTSFNLWASVGNEIRNRREVHPLWVLSVAVVSVARDKREQGYPGHNQSTDTVSAAIGHCDYVLASYCP